MERLAVDEIEDERLGAAFRTHVEASAFPCVGAKSALAQGALKLVICHDLASSWDDLDIHKELILWSRDYADQPDGFRSLAFVFRQSRRMSEEVFEKHMWARLQSLTDKDKWRGEAYSEAVSSDPSDPHFGLSFGSQAYFVVGMHPGASRPARQFERPALVFNLHDQFVQLRDSERYERMRETILQRDQKFAGSINPMLARHGEISEARQYSGRKVPDTWECPLDNKRDNR